MPQLSFDALLEREKEVSRKEEAISIFCREMLLTITALEEEALNGTDKGIRAGKLFAVKRIRTALQKLPS